MLLIEDNVLFIQYGTKLLIPFPINDAVKAYEDDKDIDAHDEDIDTPPPPPLRA